MHARPRLITRNQGGEDSDTWHSLSINVRQVAKRRVSFQRTSAHKCRSTHALRRCRLASIKRELLHCLRLNSTPPFSILQVPFRVPAGNLPGNDKSLNTLSLSRYVLFNWNLLFKTIFNKSYSRV